MILRWVFSKDVIRVCGGTVILPGTDFRGKEIQLQAGLAVKTASGYDLKMLDLIENVYDPDKTFIMGSN